MLLRRTPFRSLRVLPRRYLSNISVPFEDDLTAFEDDSLADFQHYHDPSENQQDQQQPHEQQPLSEVAAQRNPVVFISKLNNPYLNLAIEDYVYNAMPKPESPKDNTFNRLMFYVNTPCVVIGKNQNPWQEVNLPVLNSLGIPMLRRRSGGGTVVHDLGNVNYSYMTTKGNFDRFLFIKHVTDAVNKSDPLFQIEANERGDIVSQEIDGVHYKISGSAYKLSKGKSYHHGTMLLNLKLDVLGKLLHRDEDKLGVVDAMSSIASVKSKVINLEMDSEKFIEVVSEEFKSVYGPADDNKEAQEFNDMLGLLDFMGHVPVTVYTVDEATELPEEIHQTAEELKQWSWKFGHTPKFTHTFTNKKHDFTILFKVEQGLVKGFELDFKGDNTVRNLEIQQSFQYLELHIQNNPLQYTGSNVAGFVLDDDVSDWIGESIDGTT
ncbi:putative lipoate-protein ligase A [Candida viswanathii]|uniref:Putative lipoate-protein ligase A n=1 Tax=Candida viswanathii TaxID=5486 RepID=A0A367YH68_9ASCO|nr:putative lipoate-protein ligase A [Candida viswanathii]